MKNSITKVIFVALLIGGLSACNKQKQSESTPSSDSTSAQESSTSEEESQPGHTHQYDFENIVWTWEGYSSAKAKFTCKTCEVGDEGHEVELTATITSEITTHPSCGVEGEKTYTALVNFQNRDFTDTKTEALNALEHSADMEHPVWNWASDYWSAELQFKCSNCGEVFVSIPAQVSYEKQNPSCGVAGKEIFTAKATYEEKEYTDVKEFDLDALEHEDDDGWEYNEENHYHVCKHCGEQYDVAPHSFSDWNMSTLPSATAPGVISRSCECGYTEERNSSKTLTELNAMVAKLVDWNAFTYPDYEALKPYWDELSDEAKALVENHDLVNEVAENYGEYYKFFDVPGYVTADYNFDYVEGREVESFGYSQTFTNIVAGDAPSDWLEIRYNDKETDVSEYELIRIYVFNPRASAVQCRFWSADWNVNEYRTLGANGWTKIEFEVSKFSPEKTLYSGFFLGFDPIGKTFDPSEVWKFSPLIAVKAGEPSILAERENALVYSGVSVLVEAKIDALKSESLTLFDGALIQEARNEFDSLPAIGQNRVSNIAKLLAVEAEYAKLGKVYGTTWLAHNWWGNDETATVAKVVDEQYGQCTSFTNIHMSDSKDPGRFTVKLGETTLVDKDLMFALYNPLNTVSGYLHRTSWGGNPRYIILHHGWNLIAVPQEKCITDNGAIASGFTLSLMEFYPSETDQVLVSGLYYAKNATMLWTENAFTAGAGVESYDVRRVNTEKGSGIEITNIQGDGMIELEYRYKDDGSSVYQANCAGVDEFETVKFYIKTPTSGRVVVSKQNWGGYAYDFGAGAWVTGHEGDSNPNGRGHTTYRSVENDWSELSMSMSDFAMSTHIDFEVKTGQTILLTDVFAYSVEAITVNIEVPTGWDISDIYDQDAVVYAWVWGGKYGNGTWVETSKIGANQVGVNIDRSANGMLIVRMASGTTSPSWDAKWNQTGDIDLILGVNTFNGTLQ